MVSTAKRGNVLLTAALALAASGLGASRAEAQWGFGGFGGFGFGGGLYTYVPQPVTEIDQYTMARMGHVHGPTQNNVYSGNPNAYYNHLRDNGFVDRYYPDRREPSYYGYSSRHRPQQATPTAAMVRVKPIVPLTSFYNDKNELVWPGDAPKDGDLKEKRSAFDKASLAVLEETKKSGSATIGSVTEARRKLVDYGRPALDYVKAHETPRVADSFHGFLLSLYDSLAQATNPPSGP
jgi:hypothetical protein